MPEFYVIFAGKIIKMHEFFIISARKINKIRESVMIFASIMPEFYMIIVLKLFS